MEIVLTDTGTMAASKGASFDNVKSMASVFERRKSVGATTTSGWR